MIMVKVQAVDEALQENQHARALILALRLNEFSLIRKCVEAVPPWEISDITRAIPPSHLGTLCTILAEFLDKSPHLEFLLQWCEVCSLLASSACDVSEMLGLCIVFSALLSPVGFRHCRIDC